MKRRNLVQTSKQQEILSGSLEKQEKGKFRRSKREFKIVTKERRLGLFYIILFPFKWQLITLITELDLTHTIVISNFCTS